MEQWLSTWRHHYCPEGDDGSSHCQETLSSLRHARCSTGKTALAALTADVECRGSGAAINGAVMLLTAVLAFVTISATY